MNKSITKMGEFLINLLANSNIQHVAIKYAALMYRKNITRSDSVRALVNDIYLRINNDTVEEIFKNAIFKLTSSKTHDITLNRVHSSNELYLFDNVIFESKETCPDIDYNDKRIELNFYVDQLNNIFSEYIKNKPSILKVNAIDNNKIEHFNLW